MRFPAQHRIALILCCVLTAWVFFLRAPYFDRPAWNLDEGIHATIARTILDGGVMYRDVIDQRTPLTYYLVAGFFGIFGVNNMPALHALLAAMVTATALGLFLIGRRWRSPGAGLWAALIFCALTTNLLYIGDTHSLSTEWFVILFTTWSTWWFWRTWQRRSFWLAAVSGAGFAAAFLSKQPGLLDFGAPLALLVYGAAAGRIPGVEASRQLAGLCAGFVTATAAVMAYFWAHGALADFYFYAWTYNLVYYGPETTAADRVQAAIEGFQMLWRHYPVIGLALIAGIWARANSLGQNRLTEEERTTHPAALYLLAWTALSWAGAASSGRVYGHYYVQMLPAITLVAGWLLADFQARIFANGAKWIKALAIIALAAAAWSVVAGPLRGPWPATLGPDYSADPAKYVREHSRPTDKIFVWGYDPDFYLVADRRPASRFIYCSFPTGLIPWTNVDPKRDTGYAVVPGTMEIILRELEANRPEYFVDTSRSEARNFSKYPLTKFRRLAAWVDKNYVEVEPARFRPHGFRMLKIKDGARRIPLSLAGGGAQRPLDEPYVAGPATTDPVPVEYEARGAHPEGRLQRLELLIDDEVEASASFEPLESLTVRFTVHFENLTRGPHQLKIRATAANGETRLSAPLAVESAPASLPPEQRVSFALPRIVSGPIPERVAAPYGALAREEAGALVFFVHAPSVIVYTVPAGSGRLRGRFGLRPGAYAASNNGRTDGAEFIVTWIDASGRRTELLHRLLRPWEEAADRGEHPFDVFLPADRLDGRLELAITNGPNNNSASDWTYWSDLLLSSSPK